MTKKELEKAIIENIEKVFDPEIPVNIYDLGLIYEIRIDDDNNVYVVMTLTAPNCPEAETIPPSVKSHVEHVPGVNKVTVELTFDPPWSRDMLSEAAQLELGLM